MLIKLPIIKNNKLTFDNFKLENNNNKIILNTLDNTNYKNLICLNSNSYKNMEIYFPLTFNISNNIIYNELFFVLSLYYQKNDYNFIYLIEKKIQENICNKYNFVNINNIKNLEFIYKQINNINLEYNTLKEYIHYLFYKLNYNFNLSLCIIYLNYYNVNISVSNKILQIIEKIHNQTILFYGNKDLFKNHLIYINNNFNKIINNTNYFLSNKNKLLKVIINNHDTNFIYVNNKKIKKNKYKINKYPEKLKNYITIHNLIYFTINSFNYYNISDIIFKKKKIINLCSYFIHHDYNNIIIDKNFNFNDNLYKQLTYNYYYVHDNYNFFMFKKNIDNKEYDENIYNILINNYDYPFYYNKKKLSENFKKIIYYFFKHIKKIEPIKGSNKLRIKYIHNSLLKLLDNLKNKNYTITNYYKIYTDYIFITLFNIIIDTNFLNLDNNYLQIIKNNYFKNMKGIIILHLITWKNFNKKLNLYIYILKLKNENNKLLFFENKINMNIIYSEIDTKVKKIIIDPLCLFNFLNKEKDFIKWINILKNNVSLLYDNPIKIDNKDLKKIGKIIYILTKITTQDLEDNEYANNIKLLKKYDYLILFNDRINLKIKKIIRNTKINLGYLAKHIILENESVCSLSSENDSYEDLNNKLRLMTKRYYKYKGKYLSIKMSELSNNIT